MASSAEVSNKLLLKSLALSGILHASVFSRHTNFISFFFEIDFYCFGKFEFNATVRFIAFTIATRNGIPPPLTMSSLCDLFKGPCSFYKTTLW